MLCYIVQYCTSTMLSYVMPSHDHATLHYYTMLHYAMLCYTILCYTTLYCAALHYTMLRYATLYCTILYYTILYYTILYYTILYYTILYYTILYYTILYSVQCWLQSRGRPLILLPAPKPENKINKYERSQKPKQTNKNQTANSMCTTQFLQREQAARQDRTPFAYNCFYLSTPV